MKGHKYLNNKKHNFRNCEFESYTIFYDKINAHRLIFMQNNKIVKLSINYVKLFSNKFLKQENIFLFVYIIKTIYIRTKCSPNLPSVSCLERF